MHLTANHLQKLQTTPLRVRHYTECTCILVHVPKNSYLPIPVKKPCEYFLSLQLIEKNLKFYHNSVAAIEIQVPQTLDFHQFLIKTPVSYLNPQEPEWKPLLP